MILDKLVLLQTKSVTFDSEAMEIEVWTANQTYIRANVQPNNSSQMLIKEYANSDASYEYIIFTEVNTSLVAGQRIVDGTDYHDIMRVKKWPNHYELICSPMQR